MFALELYRWGIYPREISGLAGLLLGPLIHSSTLHLFAEHAAAVRFGYGDSICLSQVGPHPVPAILLGSGLGVWLFGRPSCHIGASGLAHGLMFFLRPRRAALGRDRRWRCRCWCSSMAGMVWGSSRRTGVSFEAHFFGAVTGLALAFVLRHHDPTPPKKSINSEDKEEDDPVIGDQWREP